MLLRNYDNIMTAIRYPLATSSSSTTITDKDVFGDGHLNFKDINNKLQTIYINRPTGTVPLNCFNANAASNGAYGSSINNTVIWCGRGSKDVSYDDYKLESAFTINTDIVHSTLSISTPVYNTDDNCWIYQVKRSFQAMADIEVCEIGMLFPFNYQSGYSTACLIYRDTITPKSVAKDSYFTISITLSYSANPNDPVRVSANVE
jgi:hypothetical protein